MPNPIKGQVPLALKDGREFTLVLDFEGLVQAEAAYRKPLALMLAEAAAGFAGASRALLYGALTAFHPEITLRDASTIFQTDPDRISEALERAIEAAMPERDASEERDGENPPGKPSGANGARLSSTPRSSGSKRRARSA